MFEIGSSLRDARTRQGLDLIEIEGDTKIRAKYLRALEDEHFDLLPGDAYTKGFLRAYADRLGLDGQLYVDEYNSRFSAVEEPLFSAKPRQRAHRRLESQAVLIALAGIVTVTVLVIAAWQLGGSTPGENGDAVVPQTGASPSASETNTVGETVATEPESVSDISLAVAATDGESTVEVRRSSLQGKLLFEGTLTPGQGRTFSGARRFWVQVGDLGNLTFTVNGILDDRLAGAGAATILVTEDGASVVSSP